MCWHRTTASDLPSQFRIIQFKTAVSASSPSSSPPPSSQSSSTPSLTITQANTLQALHQEQLARLASVNLPKLASAHSRRFLQLACLQTQNADTMWSSAKIQAVQYRRSLWAEHVEPETAASEEGKIVPDFYHKHNRRCSRCALPLVAGLNQVTLRQARRGTGKKRTRKRISTCTLCHHKTRT